MIRKVVLAEKWDEVTDEINRAIETGLALVAPGGRVQLIDKDFPTDEIQHDALSQTLSGMSEGELYFVSHTKRELP